MTIGASGGTVASSDGVVTLSIPAGALPANVSISIGPTTTSATGTAGTAYEIGPTGTQFSAPVTLTFAYAGVSLGTHSAADLQPGTVTNGAWQLLANNATDTTKQTVSGTTTHLSIYGLFFSAGQVCKDVMVGCSGSTGGGGVCSTCASLGTSTPCSGYPGSSQTACVDTANAGADVTCCFPVGSPICFMEGSGCHPAMGSSSCTPSSCTEVCAAEIPGSTVQSCTSAATSNTAVCCLPPGTVGSGDAGGGDSSTTRGAEGGSSTGIDASACSPSDAGACTTGFPNGYSCPDDSSPQGGCQVPGTVDAGAGNRFWCCP